jgi:Trypsin-co-occurring domain 1
MCCLSEGGNVASLVRIPLDDGGSILIEASSSMPEGPVKAGRMGEAIQDATAGLGAYLSPVTDMARAVMDQLRKAGPEQVDVEFGVDLAVQAGAVITKTGAGCHLMVRLSWKNRELDAGTA